MEQITDVVGNPTALLIERIFWMGIGGFLGIAIISSLIRGLNEKTIKTKNIYPKDLKDVDKKAIKQNT